MAFWAFWRKKSDGFDWQEYVRTTIQLRRKQRRARLEDVRKAAAEQAKAAGGVVARGVAQSAEAGWKVSVAAWQRTIAQPSFALPALLIGGVALLSGSYRWLAVAPDREAMLPLVVGALLLVLVAPLAWPRLGEYQNGFRTVLRAGLGSSLIPLGGMAVGVMVLGWFAFGRIDPTRPDSSTAPAVMQGGSGDQVLEGRAVALSGEMIRLQGKLLHLSGIEAPDGRQTCTRADKQWQCGQAAREALDRLSRSHPFRCIAKDGPDPAGRLEASCTIDGQDVAAALVRSGHVFSAATYFGGYAALETEARRAKTGLWAGEAERPADYRAKIWDTAKAAAPDGCPVKGRNEGGKKTFLMPWSDRYESTSVRTNKGDRWFCDEREALAAGYKPASSRPIAER